jgi:predicted MPP superfamily phosphohydrolase
MAPKYTDLFFRELLVMAPLVAAQVGIAMTLLRRTRPNRTLWITSIALVIVDALVCSFVLLSKGWMAGWLAPASFYLWFGLVDTPGHIWLFCAAPAYLIFVVYNWFVKQAARETSPERRKLIKAAGGIAIASPFAVMAFGVLVGRFDFQVREVDVPIANLHPDLDGLRILQLSDVHLGEFLSEQQFSRAIDMCDGLHPHLAIMTGDLITRDQDPVDACIRQLARVKSDAGMLGCLGNHEIYTKSEERVQKEAAKHGIQFLRSENRQLRFGAAALNIAGVDYQRSSLKKKYLAGAEKLIVPGPTNILLSHNPDVFPVAAAQGWDLTLAGHTHGGQVTLEIVEQSVNIARFATPFVAGQYRLGQAACYVTRGIGTIALPARIGVPPEITLLRLRKA